MILLLSLCCLGAFQDAPTDVEIEWLKQAAHPLAHVEAGQGFEDLEPLRDILGDARVVGLGESTHGSREQFQMKHRLVEFLVRELGFEVFSIEASMPESFRVDDYVSRGEGDPAKLIRGMYFWTWSTEEVLDMVEWMQTFNEERGDRRGLRFTGFDMQTPDVAAEIVVENVREFDEDLAEAIRERYEAMIRVRGGGEEKWTSATASLPKELVAGKRIEFSGKARTDNVEYAALWFRADRGSSSAAFMNTVSQHESEDGWIEHKITLDIPEDIDAVLFGLIHSGAGSAWFDDLQLRVEGEVVQPGGFDFGFEERSPFRVIGRGYRGRIDRTHAAAGEASFRIDRVAPMPGAPGSMTAAEAEEMAGFILEEVEELEAELREALGLERADWTLQMARVVQQCLASRAAGRQGGAVRDRSMADNVLWLLDQDPDAKIILWAHNGHIANDSFWMGAHLEKALGEDYVPIGFTTSRGGYRAVANDGSGLGNHDLVAPPPGSIESYFDAAGFDIALLDARLSEPGSATSGWLRDERTMRSVGAMEQDSQFWAQRTCPKFEVLLHIAETSPALPMGSR